MLHQWHPHRVFKINVRHEVWTNKRRKESSLENAWLFHAPRAPLDLNMAVCMRTWRYYVLPLLGCFIGGLASNLQGAFDQIVSHHAKDLRALNRTLDSLTNIAENLFNEPENPKYRKIRLLNKVVWERVGSVDGGISFMSALGFDLNPGTHREPSKSKR